MCDICGLEADEYWMFAFNTGTKMVWLCWDCYKRAQREMHSEEISRKKRIQKAMNARKKTGRL